MGLPRLSNFVNVSYDCRANWTQLGPITIINYMRVFLRIIRCDRVLVVDVCVMIRDFVE